MQRPAKGSYQKMKGDKESLQFVVAYIRLRSIENFCYLLHTFAIYCTIWDFYLLSKNKFWKTEECGKSKFRPILANQLTLLALQVVFVYRPCYKDLFIKIRTTNVVKLLLFL